jgi:beta-lactamase regulating signal transducer with metallopeptidase domain
MSAEILPILLRATLAASAAILIVLLLRRPLRAAFGAVIAYSFWLLVPIATLAAFLPARVIVSAAPVAASIETNTDRSADTETIANAGTQVDPASQIAWPDIEPSSLLLTLWLTGVVFSVLLLLYGQRRFMRNADAAGPAVIGIVNPRIVLPADFNQRYTPAERDLVIAHERAHIEAFDAQINAIAALAQCLNWFNPLFHVARAALRVDQELACDARVMARHADAKRVYAEAMLKTQLAAQAVPLGCQWPPIGAQPLKERITMLARPRPTSLRIALGATLCAVATLTAGAAAWATQEPRVVHVSQQRETTTLRERGLGRQLVEALQEGRMTEAADLIEAGADVNYHLAGDGTPLVIASRFGSRSIVELLIDRGADVNKPAPGDGNPLIMASAYGHIDVVTLLVARGANVDGVVYGDETPLINAARSNQLDVARYLVDHGADVNLAVIAPTVDGRARRSPLSEASRRGHDEMVRFLRASGATA